MLNIDKSYTPKISQSWLVIGGQVNLREGYIFTGRKDVFVDTSKVCTTCVYQKTCMRMSIAVSLVIANRVSSYTHSGITLAQRHYKNWIKYITQLVNRGKWLNQNNCP